MIEKLIRECTNEGIEIGYSFWCPGCKTSLLFYTTGNLIWEFNRNLEKPSFTPSLKNTWPAVPTASEEFKEWRTERICHLFITDGNIQYCEDSFHDLKGKIIPLQPRPKYDL